MWLLFTGKRLSPAKVETIVRFNTFLAIINWGRARTVAFGYRKRCLLGDLLAGLHRLEVCEDVVAVGILAQPRQRVGSYPATVKG